MRKRRGLLLAILLTGLVGMCISPAVSRAAGIGTETTTVAETSVAESSTEETSSGSEAEETSSVSGESSASEPQDEEGEAVVPSSQESAESGEAESPAEESGELESATEESGSESSSEEGSSSESVTDESATDESATDESATDESATEESAGTTEESAEETSTVISAEDISAEAETLIEAAISNSVDYSAVTNVFKSWWESVQLAFISKILQILLAFVIFFVGKRLINSIIKLLDKLSEKRGWDPTISSFARNAMRAVLYIILIMVILTCVGFEVASLAAIISSAGVALGLALQGSLSNLAGGIVILLMKPFQLGDYISTNTIAGTVKEIGLVYTTLVAPDDRTVIVPNGTLAAATIENYAQQETRRVEVQCSIAYSADLLKAKEIFAHILEAEPSRVPDKPVDVFVADLADSGVVLQGQVFVPWTEYLSTIWSVREKLKLAYDEEGIEIPFPQMDVHMKSDEREKKEIVRINLEK